MKGYVRKRGTKWSFTVDIGKDPVTGKRKQKSKSGFKTKKEAEKALNELLYEVEKGEYILEQDVILKDFIHEWFKTYQHRLRATTAEQYLFRINKWIIPLLGHIKIQDLKPTHAQFFSKKLLDELQENTAHKIYFILKTVMDYAVDLEIIRINPFKKISIVREKKRKVDTWTFKEMQHFLNVVKKYDLFFYGLFYTAAYTGMRKGEILALTRAAVDIEQKTISVKQSVSETKKEGVSIGDLKTPSAYRKVTIDDHLASILKEQIHKNNEMKLKMGEFYEDSDLIFCHPNGRVWRPTSINRPMQRFIERSGVKPIRFHDLRHTHASLLLELGVNPKVVADRLGHSSTKLTLDTYSHVSLQLHSDVADLFSKKANQTAM